MQTRGLEYHHRDHQAGRGIQLEPVSDAPVCYWNQEPVVISANRKSCVVLKHILIFMQSQLGLECYQKAYRSVCCCKY